MIGFEVAKQSIDQSVGIVALQFRDAFVGAEKVRIFLQNNPVPPSGDDPLVEVFGYAAAEAAFIRTTFDSIALMQDDYTSLLGDLTKFTALT